MHWNEIWENMRQLRYPGEFRIGSPAWPADLQNDLEELVRTLQQLLNQDTDHQTSDSDIEKLMVEVGTGLWRTRKKIVPMAEKDGSQEMRVAVWAVESTWDKVHQAGVEVQDHDGEFISGGEALHVLAFEPSPGCIRETVIETLKPTIYYRNRMVQAGEVIVGTPVNKQQ